MKKIIIILVLAFWANSLLSQNDQVNTFRYLNGNLLSNDLKRNVSDFSASDIQFWIGEGSNEMVAIFTWCQEQPMGVAYGYRWNGTKTLLDLFMDIDDADPRFELAFTDAGQSLINYYSYHDDAYNLYIDSYTSLCYLVNGNWASGVGQTIHDGDQMVMEEFGNCDAVTNIIPAPSLYSDPIDVEISQDDITFWLGNGNNRAVFAVNWCDSAVALAWGVRFDSDSILLSDLMNTITLLDDRIDFSLGGYGISDITYQDNIYNLSLVGDWWIFNVNGQTAPVGYDALYIHNNDFIKWGDESCGIADSNFRYIWTTPIQPVAIPTYTIEVYDGNAGSMGSQAVYCENPSILGWATHCDLERGYQNIESHSILASYGDDNDAVGAVTVSASDVVSLGDGGTAVLTFDIPITNGEGYDFAVFENALNDAFLELAFVEVSSDGIHYFRFPSISNTPAQEQVTNSGTLDPTHIHNLAGKYRAGWGTPFDLELLSGYTSLDINQITHVKLIDVVGCIDTNFASFDSRGMIINDPYPTNFASSGFDLDGVAVLNGWNPSKIHSLNNIAFQIYPNPCTQFVNIKISEEQIITLYNLQGQLLISLKSDNNGASLNLTNYPSGIYFIKVNDQIVKLIKQ